MRPAIVCGIALGTRQSAIGQFLSLSLVKMSENFAKVTQATLSVRKWRKSSVI